MSLWGDEFNIPETKDEAKKIIKKSKTTKKVKSVEDIVKSKTIPIEEKLEIIKVNVYKILGKYKDDTIVIRTKEELSNYIDAAIENGIISIDTETNNSLDTITCKIMGGCIYTPGQKNAYIPINHVDLNTRERLDWQLTEEDLKEQFDRLSNTKIIMHNAKFDKEVIYCTCKSYLNVYWDTSIASQLLNENESHKLKDQYIAKIDPTQGKYSIDHLFEKLEYAIIDPELFALYAATDAFITYKLYEYQLNEFTKPENKDVYKLLMDVEIPIIDVVTKMELQGVEVDSEYAKKLSVVYHKKSNDIQKLIDDELLKLKPKIDSWRLSTEANVHPPAKNASGVGKSKNEQLSDPVELGSPTQMAILLYDILKVGIVDKKTPRGTGAEILEALADKVPICKLLVDKRGVDILINTFIDKLPELIKPNTGRLHASFNTYGAKTGRFSSSDPNLQNIPSHAKEIRMMFKAREDNFNVELEDSYYKVKYTDEIEIDNNIWKSIKNINIGDRILNSDNNFDIIKDIKLNNEYYYLYI